MLPILRMTIALQYLTVFLGVVWGRGANSSCFWHCDIIDEWWLFGTIALILLIVAAYRARSKKESGEKPPVRAVSVGMAIYAGCVMFFDPFTYGLFGYGNLDANLLYCVGACLVPLLTLKVFVRSRSWLGLVGDMLFSVVCIACFFETATAYRGGNGFSLPPREIP